MPIDKVLLVEPRGYCAGVEAALKTLAWMVVLHREPVYCVHAIVHNRSVVERFERLGVVFVDEIHDVPAGAPVVLSAHGSAPDVVTFAGNTTTHMVDAVCPLVRKVHHEIRTRAAAGATVLYVGHAGHDEAVAAVSIAPEHTSLITTAADVDSLPEMDGPVALLAQTTLGLDELAAVERAARRRFDVWTPRHSDLCYATTNRQRALRAACRHSDAVVVVGSATSSNTRALAELAETQLAKRNRADRTFRVDGPDELPDDLRGVVAVTAGASAPEEAVLHVIAHLDPRNGVERFAPLSEDAYFPLPPTLRTRLIDAIGAGDIDDDLASLFLGDQWTPADALLSNIEARKPMPRTGLDQFRGSNRRELLS